MDEPFSALDPETRRDLQATLVEIWRATGRTIVFVTHGIEEALAVGSRAALLTARPARVLRTWDLAAHPDADRQALAGELLEALAEQVRQQRRLDPIRDRPPPNGRTRGRTRWRPPICPRDGPCRRRPRSVGGCWPNGSTCRRCWCWPLGLAVWSAVSARFGPYLFPPPGRVLDGLVGIVASGQLWVHVGASLSRIGLGFGAAVAVSLLAGLLGGRTARGPRRPARPDRHPQQHLGLRLDRAGPDLVRALRPGARSSPPA